MFCGTRSEDDDIDAPSTSTPHGQVTKKLGHLSQKYIEKSGRVYQGSKIGLDQLKTIIQKHIVVIVSSKWSPK